MRRETLAAGVHIWIAPEGTRSPTGKLLPFKKRGFNLALEAELPVLPVSVRGTRNGLPARGMRRAQVSTCRSQSLRRFFQSATSNSNSKRDVTR